MSTALQRHVDAKQPGMESRALLPRLESAEEILKCLEGLTASYKEHILRIVLRCDSGVADNRILCTVVVKAHARSIASAIGGNVFSTSFLYRVIHPLRSDFRCVNRHNGRLLKERCRCCAGPTAEAMV